MEFSSVCSIAISSKHTCIEALAPNGSIHREILARGIYTFSSRTMSTGCYMQPGPTEADWMAAVPFEDYVPSANVQL